MNNLFDRLRQVDERLPVMILDLVAKRKKFSGRVEESSFRRIPSIRSFEVTPNEENLFLRGTGLDKKLPADKKWELNKSQDRFNKYMKARIRAMRHVLAAGRPDIFWAMVEREMKRSSAFRISSINAVLDGWYKNLDVQKVVNVVFGVNKILSEDLTNLKYFRVDIPKGDPVEILKFFKDNPGKAWPGKMRPLGVPTAPWRVVLHMWNGFLTLFLEEELKKFNHAYMPGVGTKSALEHFILGVRHHANVYEFDIKGFFNNVSILNVRNLLEERGMPDATLARLTDILINAPVNLELLQKELEDPSKSYDKYLARRKAYILGEGIPGSALQLAVAYYYHHTGIDLMEDEGFLMSLPPGDDPETERLMLQGFFGDKTEEDIKNELITGGFVESLLKGLPQGAAPSTILSILALADWYKELKSKGIKLLMYADDGILYSDEPFEPSPPPGFEFAEEKSRWVRREGKNLTDEMKFLGVIYNFNTKRIRGATRKGSTLEFGENQENILQLIGKLIPNGGSLDIMGSLAKSNIFGLALSKLYGGKFGRLQYEEHVEYNNSSYWGKYYSIERLQRDREMQRVASSIACGWLRILVSHSMGRIDRKEFRQQTKEYHLNKEWQKDTIDENDVRAAYGWQSAWEAKEW